MHVLSLEPQSKELLWSHLLPLDSPHEQAAFLFCHTSIVGKLLEFKVVGLALLQSEDFVVQGSDYLELVDSTRVEIIKRAHSLGASLAEFHSHPGPWPAAFSLADRHGLKETVPHMRWRLKRRPYLAIVVAPKSFDALVWTEHPRVPGPLSGIRVGDDFLTPTNASLEGWDDD